MRPRQKTSLSGAPRRRTRSSTTPTSTGATTLPLAGGPPRCLPTRSASSNSALAQQREPVAEREQLALPAVVGSNRVVESPDSRGVLVVDGGIKNARAPQHVVDADKASGAQPRMQEVDVGQI